MTKEQLDKLSILISPLINSLERYQTIFDLHRDFINHWLIKLLFPKRYYNLLVEVHAELIKDVHELEELKQLFNELNLNEQ